jgi:2-oxoglutarate dehydrogenase E2 component (dihydrolipoamide succinyltransferase)
MAKIEVLLPKMGESVAEATIIKWLKNEGDSIEADEPIIEIATDKVDSEVPSPGAGILTQRLFKEGDVVQVGQLIAVISSEKEAAASKPEVKPVVEVKSENSKGNGNNSSHAKEIIANPSLSKELAKTGSGGKFYSPLVRTIASTEGVTMQELESIQGSGMEGRVTKKDILNYLPNRKSGGTAVLEKPVVTAPKVNVVNDEIKRPAVSVNSGDEIIEMDRMRKLIADHMVMSKRVSPHVTSFVEADVTNLVLWRERIKKSFEKREGEKITFTPVFVEAIAKAIRDFPMINISVDGDKIIKRKDINVGMATALPSGNLIVPVIRNADRLNLLGLTKAVNDLANRARNNQLKPDDISGGTYTISNVGSFGNVMGTPIINQPQVAIMALGAIKKKPAVIETESGDTIGVRHFMYLSHSYDHRVVDGALGGMFVRKVADYLEQFDINREL